MADEMRLPLPQLPLPKLVLLPTLVSLMSEAALGDAARLPAEALANAALALTSASAVGERKIRGMPAAMGPRVAPWMRGATRPPL